MSNKAKKHMKKQGDMPVEIGPAMNFLYQIVADMAMWHQAKTACLQRALWDLALATREGDQRATEKCLAALSTSFYALLEAGGPAGLEEVVRSALLEAAAAFRNARSEA